MIDIIFEDNHLLVVEKPANIPVQEDNSKDRDMLNLLKAYLKEKYNKPGNVYLGLVHRLDRPVGGVMVFAKTSKAANRLSKQIQNNEWNKTYYTIVEGKMEPAHGTLIDYLKKDSKTNTVTVTDDKNGKYAELDYQVFGYKDSLSLLKIKLKTGRSHQIRVQLSSRGFPIWGDQRYNKNSKPGQQIALWSQQLSFDHPISKKNVSFTSELPNSHPWNLFNH